MILQMHNSRCCVEEMAGFHDSGFLIVLYFCDNKSNDENWRGKNSWSVFLNLTQIDGIHTEWYLRLNKINKILQFHISIREVKIGYHSAYTYFHSHLQELCMRPQNETNLCTGNYGVTEWMGCTRKHPLG